MSLDVADEVVVADYVRSARATAVQVSWLWSLGRPGGQATDDDLALGVWSARAETMQATLDWLRAEHGGPRRVPASPQVSMPDQLERCGQRCWSLRPV